MEQIAQKKKTDKIDGFLAYVRNVNGNTKLAVRHQVYEQCKVMAGQLADDSDEYEMMIKKAVEVLEL